jgi:hypothetical protein
MTGDRRVGLAGSASSPADAHQAMKSAQSGR